ncbi:CpaD family pilus assembly protein [Alteraurantiacibacter buctensis]|uniref:Pilus assembly protein CpaD n=1 Tax=Alteraurantiacibacter buctensis TaxID=1503981 RepID=A0A844Z185_9SPHN|nr:CpaD family pilus assembly lipoprotein [Alteraurantiacibacter buctensis]MXO72741.1 pilus assembly protein CpaD [Alteraurantiacibacter buctensis]
MNPIHIRKAASLAALSLALGLGACTTPAGVTPNHGLESINQPVVSRSNMTLDLMATPGGLAVPEQARLAEWFEALDVGYGDRIAIDDPMASPSVRADVAAAAARHGLLLADGAPVTSGFVDPGRVRVVVTRSTAHVPGCPNWAGRQSGNLGNSTSPGFGCAINGNLAAMIADPEHLLEGAAGTGDTVVMSSTKAIETYREATPTGAGGLGQVSSQETGS